MAKKYYVVWKGHQSGIFTTWLACKAQVDGFSGAKYKSFPTLAEAEQAFSAKQTSNSSDKAHSGPKKKVLPLSQSDIANMPFDIKVFTDGGCEPNPGEAGTGIAVYENNKLSALWYGLYHPKGTNNTAELQGLMQALLLAKAYLSKGQSVAIYCDSKYSIDCITKWAVGWEKKGWVKPSGEIKNLDLIKPAYSLYQTLSSAIKIYHVNGHVGIEGNELADRMSILAIDSKHPDFVPYSEGFDIPAILALRSG
ncbi:viroplasmin family protein [Pseudoalteromonas aurantia]|uniref:Ribonuclease H n=1 Tax=Pseudoalteromonas aurantia TaxID=43654 RepID=A0A5S3VAG1_9GAMM|nr:ribonuclease H family protein [Pseudoalteromonas aurantia]TMO68906.1 ribonuclease HI [Pseudoalteromonas aurantia]TMO71952.1 ribonuclease HI [Pseudoalteromonas aurantia]